MPPLTLNQAAKAAKKSKAALLDAIKKGRLSARQDEETKVWQIELSELLRVYPHQSSTSNENQFYHQTENQSTREETTLLRQQITLLGQERDRERSQLQTTIDDLRKRLDTESEERRKLTAMITHQNQGKPEENRPTGSRMVWLVVLLVVISVSAVLALRFGVI